MSYQLDLDLFTHMVREDTASESHVPCPTDVLAISLLPAGGTHVNVTDTLEVYRETLRERLQPGYVIPVERRVVERGSLRDGSHSGSWLGAEPAPLELLRGLSVIPNIRVDRQDQCAGAVSTRRDVRLHSFDTVSVPVSMSIQARPGDGWRPLTPHHLPRPGGPAPRSWTGRAGSRPDRPCPSSVRSPRPSGPSR